jgi:hypothetical protein
MVLETTMQSFSDWCKSLPEDLRNKSLQNGDEEERNKPMLNQVNDVLLNLDLAGKHDVKPTYEEIKSWLDGGQVDVLRMSTP